MVGMAAILIPTLIIGGGTRNVKATQTELALTLTQEEVISPLPALNPGRIAQGSEVYARECATCHGANLEGDPNWETKLGDGSNPPPPLNDSGHASHHSDAGMLTILNYGVNYGKESFMPGYKGILRDDEQMAVLEFIKSKWSEEEFGHQHNLVASVRLAWVAPADQGANAEISLVLDNPATFDTRLMLPATEVADRVEIVDSNGSVLKDTSLTALTLDQKLAPGGVHLRLVGLKQTLKIGDVFWLRLQLTGMGEILAEVKVLE
jgi:mono/diheme cytochrome c family protein